MKKIAAHNLPRLLTVIMMLACCPTVFSGEKPLATDKNKKIVPTDEKETQKIIALASKTQQHAPEDRQKFLQAMGLSKDEIKILSHVNHEKTKICPLKLDSKL
jgi:hypothetical protein